MFGREEAVHIFPVISTKQDFIVYISNSASFSNA